MASPTALVIEHEPFAGGACEVGAHLQTRGWACRSHIVTADLDRPNEAVPFPPIDDLDLLVVMGSIRSLPARDDIDSWVGAEIDLIARAHRDGLPVLGVCFGGQLLAEALGGSVEVAPRPEIGWYELSTPAGAENPVGPGPWFAWHHDRFDPPPGSELLAETEVAPQLFRSGRSVGTQFHPEVNAAHIDTWLELAGDEYLAANGVDQERARAEARAHEARNVAQCQRLVDWFLDDVAS